VTESDELYLSVPPGLEKTEITPLAK